MQGTVENSPSAISVCPYPPFFIIIYLFIFKMSTEIKLASKCNVTYFEEKLEFTCFYFKGNSLFYRFLISYLIRYV